MTTTEFTLWLNGYLEALETEGIEEIKIKNIREKMKQIKSQQPNQERVVFSPNVNPTSPQRTYEQTMSNREL
tara:strand:- start:331 stop:546 length:216 start_codon:yes stop_codon:yes gene_type:complete